MSKGSAASEELQDLYRDLIIDHARSPRHFGRLEQATHTAEGINPLCGDKLRLYLQVNDKRCIEDTRFEGTGCAISVASASLLTDTVIGLPVDKAIALFAAMTNRLTRGQSDGVDGVDLDKLKALDGVRDFPSRVKCATLAWHALRAALTEQPTTATTEQ